MIITILRTYRNKLAGSDVNVVFTGTLGAKSKGKTLTVEEAERMCGEFANKEQVEGYDEIEYEVILTDDRGDRSCLKRIEIKGKKYA